MPRYKTQEKPLRSRTRPCRPAQIQNILPSLYFFLSYSPSSLQNHGPAPGCPLRHFGPCSLFLIWRITLNFIFVNILLMININFYMFFIIPFSDLYLLHTFIFIRPKSFYLIGNAVFNYTTRQGVSSLPSQIISAHPDPANISDTAHFRIQESS